MHSRMLLCMVGLFVCLPVLAQTQPLQFKVVDVNQAMRTFDANTMIRRPTNSGAANFSRVFPKISLSPFPSKGQPKTVLPGGFNLPKVTPVQSTFPVTKTTKK